MNNLSAQRLTQLLALAAKDSIYHVWESSYEDCREGFTAFANTQPEEIRNMLYGYADCGQMMMQRMVNLACDHMIFPEE